ncbi:MAG: hypothetical protein J6B23_07070 [Clostridia bacterium]|nr:hypothetical protein [Clostridia bacterium]
MTSHSYIKNITAKMTPEYRYDYEEDFSVWRKRAKEKLAGLLGLPFALPSDDKFSADASYTKDGLLYTPFSFQSEDGYFVSACMVKREDLTEKLPLCICLQGHSSGMHISLGEAIYENDAATIAGGRDFAVRAAREGMAAVAVEQRYMGKAGFADKARPACTAAAPDGDANQAMAALLIGRTAIGERVWDVSRTIDAVHSHFADVVDVQKTVCMGNSGGGTATFYSACMDERINVAVPSCAVCTFEASIMAMNHCPCNFIPGIRKYFDMGDLGCLIAPSKLVVVCGKDDNIFPLDGVRESYEIIKKAYAHVGCENDCALVIGNGGHQFYPDDAWPVMHKYIEK